jgi:hypothetical protein
MQVLDLLISHLVENNSTQMISEERGFKIILLSSKLAFMEIASYIKGNKVIW